MTLRTRLVLGLAAVALLLAVPLGVALKALTEAEQAAGNLRAQEVAASLLLGRIRTTTQNLRDAEKAVLFVTDSADSPAWMQREMHALRGYADSLAPLALEPLALQIRRSSVVLDRYGPLEWAAVAKGASDAADDLSERHIVPAIEAVERMLTDSEEALVGRAEHRANAAAQAASDARSLAGLLLAAALAGALVVAYWLTRSISRPVRDLERGMAAVASGKFGHQLAFGSERPDEFGRLAASYRGMAEQLAELDKLKAEFVSVASHELKTPINVILGYVALLEEGLYGTLNDQQRGVLGTVASQGRSLARLVQHLLDVSRFQAGAGRLELRPLALRPFLSDVERAFDVIARQRDVRFVVTAREPLPEAVTWDRDRMNEVLSNLLSNAFKFTSGGGQVELTVSHGDGGEQTMQLVVVDSGAGIPPEQLAHIFDKFFQASNQGAASAKGSGLGLAIAREIVGAHGGQIQVESEVGRGTRFTIHVPTHATEAGELPLESPSAGAGGRGAPAKRRIAGPEPHAKRAARDDAPHELTGSGRVDGGRRAADALADPR